MISYSHSWTRARPIERHRGEIGYVTTQAVGCRKRAAKRLGRSVDAIDRYCAGDPSNPLGRAADLLDASENPWIATAYLEVRVTRKEIATASVGELVQRFHELMSLEAQRQAREDEACAVFYRTGDLEAIAQADLEEIAIQRERAAICMRLAELRVDPREWR